MSDESYFPSTRQEALALLYVQSQDLAGKSPEDLADMYADAYSRLRARFKAMREEQRGAN